MSDSPFSEFENGKDASGQSSPFSEFDASSRVQETAATVAAPVLTEDGEVENNTDVTKCPACGANMVYDSERGKLLCEHCGTEVEVRAETSEEQAFERLLTRGNEWGDETHVYRCENCGAREILSDGEIAGKCPFCGTTNIVRTEELSGLKPNAVVPFSVGKDDAVANVRRWARRKWLAPGKFRRGAKPENVSGVYTPAFSFDTSADAWYSGVLGKYYYYTRRVNGKTVRERRLKTFPIRGQYSAFFDDILIQASDRISQESLDALQPFDTGESREYRPEYLSGYTAGQYSKDGLACWNAARGVIRDRLQQLILSRYTYDTVVSFHLDFQCRNTTYKYLLLPVYVGHCGWKKKLYHFFVSGHNGKVTGKAPVSPLKVGLLVLLGLAVVVGIAFLFMWWNGIGPFA